MSLYVIASEKNMQNKVYTAQKKEYQLNRTAAYKTAEG